MLTEQNKLKRILIELTNHLPYSIFGVIAAIIIMGFLTFIAKLVGAEQQISEASKELFHIFHPSHILFSAVTTTAMFWKHDDRNIFKAIGIGFIGSVVVCGLSDIIIPFIGGRILGYDMQAHICIIEHPQMILPFAAVGILVGFIVAKGLKRSTQYSHSVHVFLSSTASLLYLISFGLVDWMEAISGVFFVTIFAVMLPCCLSDIVFPLACTHQFCDHEKDHHTEDGCCCQNS